MGPTRIFHDVRFPVAIMRVCCKTRFSVVLKNSAGHRRDLRVKM